MTQPNRKRPEIQAQVLADIKAAVEMGIRDAADIKEILEAATHEEIRANSRKYLEDARELLSRFQVTLAQFDAVMKQFIDAPREVQGLHIDAQKALLRRMEALANTANSAEDLATLVMSYGTLTELHVQEVIRPSSTAGDDDHSGGPDAAPAEE